MQRGGVALQAVVAHVQCGLHFALVPQAAHAQRCAVGHVQRAAGQGLQLVRTAGDKGRTHRRRCAKKGQQQESMAAEVADQREIAVVVQAGHGPVVVDPGNRLHATAIPVAQPHAVDTLGAPHVGRPIAPNRNGLVGGQPARHAGGPHHFIATGLARLVEHTGRVLVHLRQLGQTGIHTAVHPGDQLQLRLAVVGGDVGMGERTAQRGRVRRQGELAVGLGAQAFFFEAAFLATQAITRNGGQPLLQ